VRPWLAARALKDTFPNVTLCKVGGVVRDARHVMCRVCLCQREM